MREALKKANVQQDLKGASFLEMVDLYEAMITNKELDVFSEAAANVEFPLISSDEMIRLPKIAAFDIKEDGRFVRCESLWDAQRIDLVNICAKLVE